MKMVKIKLLGQESPLKPVQVPKRFLSYDKIFVKGLAFVPTGKREKSMPVYKLFMSEEEVRAIILGGSNGEVLSV